MYSDKQKKQRTKKIIWRNKQKHGQIQREWKRKSK